MDLRYPDSELTTKNVILKIQDSARIFTKFGEAVDGTPLYAVRVGGDELPPVLVTAGVHAHESGGVAAVLKLLDELETEHQIYLVPMRDPFGFSGVDHCIGFAVGEDVLLTDHLSILKYLTEKGSLEAEIDELKIFKLGDFGFIWHPIEDGLAGFIKVNQKMGSLSTAETQKIKNLWGKHILLINPAVSVNGSEKMKRCWHAYLDPSGGWRHLNRCFGSDDAPVEVKALEILINKIQPGLVIDLQEDSADGFWVAAPKFQPQVSWILDIGRGISKALDEAGYPLYSFNQMSRDQHRDLEIPGFLEPQLSVPGLFWMNQSRMEQGDNLLSYTGSRVTAIGLEAPILKSFNLRVEGLFKSVKVIVNEWQAKGASLGEIKK